MDIEKILYEGINRGASDIHLVKGMQPILRINRELIKIEDESELTSYDIEYVYRYFIKEIQFSCISFMII